MSSTYTIGQVAERSGFSASALRSYEGIGLVESSTRTDSGYRLYDDGSLARLVLHRGRAPACAVSQRGGPAPVGALTRMMSMPAEGGPP